MKTLNTKQNLSSIENSMDFSIHGIVKVRLVDPAEKDVATFQGRFGPTHVPTDGEPDITIRFKEDLSVGALTYVGLNSAGFNDDGFYLLSETTGKVMARIPFEQIGSRCEIVCLRGEGSVPLLSEIINLTFLNKNYVPLHSSAFHYKGVDNLVMGWAKGGKTGVMLSFANHGARYLGDEWVILSEDGKKMFGLPSPIGLSEWQFKHIPLLMPKVGRQKKILFKAIKSLDKMYGRLKNGKYKNSFPMDFLSRSLPPLRRQLKIKEKPQKIFKHNFDELVGVPEKVFLSMSHSDPEIRIEACDSMDVARRMVSVNEYEYSEFFELYKAFKFSFPHLRNAFLENADKLQSALLFRAFEDKEAYKVLHPYPVSLEALYQQVRPYCQKTITDDKKKIKRNHELCL